MRKILLLFTPIFASVFFLSCSSAKQNDTSLPVPAKIVPQKDTLFPKGKLITSVKCSKDSSLSYALYLPESYSADKKFPIICFFDSHGSGSTPLEMYKALAEKYGYILAGSNNSKNGMSWEQNEPQIKEFMNDVDDRLQVDDRRVYTCGFSGGSRVASSVAIFDGGVAGVIGMGAGFPSLSDPIHNRFDYIGFAGNEDFNMNELIELTTAMDKTPIRHQLILFNGHHEWAPAETAEDAFIWTEFNAMKDGIISKNDSMIQQFIKKNQNELVVLEKKKKNYKAELQCKKMSAYLDGLADVSAYKKEEAHLNDSPEMKNEMLQKDKFAKQEAEEQESYRQAFVLKDWAWWETEINKLNQLSRDKKDEENAIMNKRMLNYLSLVAYMNASSALQANNFNDLEKYLKIYEKVDPKNSEHQYLYADLYARKKEDAKAISFLKNAMKLGFNDVARMESDSSFISLRNSSDYTKLLEEMKKK